MSSTEGPYQSPAPFRTFSSGKTVGLTACLLVWLFGTCALSLVCVADVLFQLQLPGAVLSVIFVVSPGMTFLSSILAPIRFHLRVLSFLISIMLMVAQFVLLFFLALATSGLDGV